MSFEPIIVLIIVVAVIIVAATIIMRITNDKHKVVRFVKNRCAKQIAVLLNVENISKEYTFSSEEEDIICSLSLEDWKHWTFQINEARETAKKYPLAFDDLIEESFPHIYSRKCFGKSNSASIADKRMSIIDSMTPEELSLVLAESSENWEARIKRNNIASKIKRENLDGYSTYCEILKKPSLSSSEIISYKKAIIEYQKAYELSKIYEGWEDKQQKFSSSYHALCSEHRKDDGRFTYQVKFNHIDKFGKLVISEFKVWQGFVDAFSFSDAEEKPQFMIRCTDNLPSFKNKNRFFKESVYNGIFNLIESAYNKEEDGTLVVFINSSRFNWEKDSYDYHYRFLQSHLKEEGIDFCDIENLTDIDRKCKYSSVIIIDFITNDEDLKSNCRIVAEYFTGKIPFIGYYTLLKEYTEAQIKLHYKKEAKSPSPNPEPPVQAPPPQNDDYDIAFVEDLFSKVHKHSYFSFIAITNTLIGEADGAEKTRKVWLDNPNKYHYKVGNRDDMIAGKYSVDGRLSYESFNMEGDRHKLKDAAKYSYYLFKEMGVWGQFKEKGEAAINFMNSMEFLRYH